MDWIVYVPKSARSNLEIGLSKGVWGHKAIFSTVKTKDVAIGDTLYFIEYLQLLQTEDLDKVRGFPRVDAKHYNGVIHSLVKCEITSQMYYSENTVWPDDIYPHRYDIRLIERKYNLPFGSEFFANHFIECVRESTLKKGSAIELGNNKNHILTLDEVNNPEVIEGRPVYRNHIRRERNPEIVRLKKESAMKLKGKLECEICSFNFDEMYGERGKGYIECHHNNPLSANSETSKTRLEDLSLLCANCHTMIHRYKPWLTLEELQEIRNGRN
ncbi:HNH endonuclease [Pseudoalteromonas sp. MMG024]|uniref:HNH endonuclease n=1 Tax=Pseudoalteromonas sp. MMG024 TaxID=2909980 RepID=UPI001F026E84|nr:HNH endonuclease [Pseudoalteromonas sp. MMG024]MCF6458356.1 HNH endonuclease [Pseudoalteromonas sp. MMG024]